MRTIEIYKQALAKNAKLRAEEIAYYADYTEEEAAHLAHTMLEDLRTGYYGTDNFPQAVENEGNHWERVLSGGALFVEFAQEFNRLTAHITGVRM